MKIKTLILLIVTIIFYSCGNSQADSASSDDRETAKNGSFKIIVDESFKPVIDQQIEVFNSAYPKVKVNVEYKPEAECFQMLDKDSATRMIIVSRKPTKEEETLFNEKFARGISYDAVALDAVAVILHPSANEKMLTMDDLRDALLGKSKYGYKAVFDNNKITANARFIRDSLLKTDTMPESVSAVKGNQAVVDFVARNPKSIGFVGVSWLNNSDNTDQFADVKNVKIIGIQCQRLCPAYTYPKPYLFRVASKEYPLVRGVYYIVKNDYGGVATNFAKWLELERGQLIFNKANMPGTKQKVTGVRDAVIEK